MSDFVFRADCFVVAVVVAPYRLRDCNVPSSFVDFGAMNCLFVNFLPYLLTSLLIYFFEHRPITFPGRRS